MPQRRQTVHVDVQEQLLRNAGIDPAQVNWPHYSTSYSATDEAQQLARTRPSFSNLAPNQRGWDAAIANIGRGRIDTSTAFAAGDPSGRLPPAAAARLRALRDAADEAWAVNHDLTDKRNELQRHRQDAEARLRRLAQEGWKDPEHPSVAQAMADRDRLTQEINALNERIARTDGHSPARLVRSIEEWLRRIPAGVEINEHLDPVKASLAPRENIHSAIDNARRKLAELRADLHAVHSAPAPAAVAQAAIRAEVNQLADHGAPDVQRFIDAGGPLQWPIKEIQADVNGFAASEGAPRVQGFASHQQVDAHALLVWLHRDEIVARLCAEVDELSDDANSLTDEERGERERALRDAMLFTERFEDALITQAGDAVPRRGDADPRAVLGLSSDLPDPRDW